VTEKVEDGIQGGEPKMPGGRDSSEVVDRAEVVKPTEGGMMWSVTGTGCGAGMSRAGQAST